MRELGYVESGARGGLKEEAALVEVIAKWCRRKRFIEIKYKQSLGFSTIKTMIKHIIKTKNDELCIDNMGFFKVNCMTCYIKYYCINVLLVPYMV
jgi:hypothetical protein